MSPAGREQEAQMVQDLWSWWKQHTSTTERGASLVEYALLLGLLAIVCIGAMSFLGGATSHSFSTDTYSMFVNP
jgi:pilus assembly protein Flp/PilA